MIQRPYGGGISELSKSPIKALTPKGKGHQFVVYADSCSGIPDGPNEENFAAINKVIAALTPPPQFIAFPGDEVRGLVADAAELEAQWRYWQEYEMAWSKQACIPIYHTTGNHTAYDPQSIDVFRKMLSHLPQNGPAGQEGLSYFVRRDDLLLVFINTLNEALGGEGWVETEWLEATLQAHADAKFKLVFGHHPVFAVNGYVGDHQRQIEAATGEVLWEIFVRHGVIAYFCSHILAFDVQVHSGVLQILTGGAGTMPLSPASAEYFHAIQAALDDDGLRYQVFDHSGTIRDGLTWPLGLPPAGEWPAFSGKIESSAQHDHSHAVHLFYLSGVATDDGKGEPQTLVAAIGNAGGLDPIWVGLRGREQRLYVLIVPEEGRSPRFWLGPSLKPGEAFEIEIGFHSGMGPGGVLWRWDAHSPWSSFQSTTAWGVERIAWPTQWVMGNDRKRGRPFRGQDLVVRQHSQRLVREKE